MVDIDYTEAVWCYKAVSTVFILQWTVEKKSLWEAEWPWDKREPCKENVTDSTLVVANVLLSMGFNLSNCYRGIHIQLSWIGLLFPTVWALLCKVVVSVMQAVNISSELKLAGALSQSVWACAEKHCSAALWEESKTERGVWQRGAHSLQYSCCHPMCETAFRREIKTVFPL